MCVCVSLRFGVMLRATMQNKILRLGWRFGAALHATILTRLKFHNVLVAWGSTAPNNAQEVSIHIGLAVRGSAARNAAEVDLHIGLAARGSGARNKARGSGARNNAKYNSEGLAIKDDS